MTPPTPAAVRGAMTELYLRTDADDAALADDPRDSTEVLRDHIRAVAQEMREPFKPGSGPWDTTTVNALLAEFADKLEGKQ